MFIITISCHIVTASRISSKKHQKQNLKLLLDEHDHTFPPLVVVVRLAVVKRCL